MRMIWLMRISMTSRRFTARLGLLVLACVMLFVPTNLYGQRKPTRAAKPTFGKSEFDGIFFSDVKSVLKGDMPRSQAKIQVAGAGDGKASTAGTDASSDDPMAWQNIVAPTTLEDLIKGSKLRLDRIVTTPAAFAGGGFQDARVEFSLQALLFAIIESYPGDVRWKESSGVSRELMSRVAANTKVGSRQVYDEAKKRLLDLGDLLNGSQLAGEAKSEIDWSTLIDRPPLMKLLEWAQTDYVSTYSASESEFEENREELRRYAELISILGKASLQEDMPDATDGDYMKFATDMITQSQQVVLAVETNNPDLARKASSQLGQSCTNCHDYFR